MAKYSPFVYDIRNKQRGLPRDSISFLTIVSASLKVGSSTSKEYFRPAPNKVTPSGKPKEE